MVSVIFIFIFCFNNHQERSIHTTRILYKYIGKIKNARKGKQILDNKWKIDLCQNDLNVFFPLFYNG